jgi:hypothetical protein
LAALKAGRRRPARMAMMAMTTNNSMRVNPNIRLAAGMRTTEESMDII